MTGSISGKHFRKKSNREKDVKKYIFSKSFPLLLQTPPVMDSPSNKDFTLFRLTPSNKDLSREGGWRGEGVFGRVGIAARGEGRCAGANGVVVGLVGQKSNALMNKKGLFLPKKYTAQ